MEIRGMDKGLLVAEALCGRGRLLAKSALTEDEQDMVRAAEIKARWLDRMMAKGLAAQLAFQEGVPIGFIEYMPIALSHHRRGTGLYQVNCLDAPHTPPWSTEPGARVPGCGMALVNAMIEDVQDKCGGVIGASTIAYTDTAGFFARLGFEWNEANGQRWLIRSFAPFELPEPITYEQRYLFEPLAGKVVLDTFWVSSCTSSPLALVRLRDICRELGDRIVLHEYCLDERAQLVKHGADDLTYFDGQSPTWSYQLTRDKIRQTLRTCLEATA
jgi:hypothetical protein